MTLRNRLGLLFLSFLILVTISVVATARMVRDQDALVINLAGRQRMLVQQITSQTLQIQAGQNQDEHRQILHDAEIVFDQTLMALMTGGETQYLPDQTVSVPAAGSKPSGLNYANSSSIGPCSGLTCASLKQHRQL